VPPESDYGTRGLLSRRFVWVAIAALMVTGIVLAWVSLTAA